MVASAVAGLVADHDRIDTAGDRAKVVITAIAFDLVRLGIDRVHLVAPLPQTLVYDIAAMVLRVPGDPRHGHPLVGQKLRCRFFDLLHAMLLPDEPWSSRHES